MKKHVALAVLLLASLPHPARADGDACAGAAEEGQRALRDGKLRHARELFLSCSSDTCKPFIRRDCTQWASEVDGLMPSIVIDAKDGGQDVADVKVTIDGEVVASKLDGKAIAIDPGPHKLAFERAGKPAVAQEIIAKEGVRARVVEVRFADATARPQAPEEPPKPMREHTVTPWIVTGLGGALVVTGAVFFLIAPSSPPNCDTTSLSCSKTLGETDSGLQRDQDNANAHVNDQKVGLVMLIAGGFLLVSGVAWHFLEPTGPVDAKSGAPWAFTF